MGKSACFYYKLQKIKFEVKNTSNFNINKCRTSYFITFSGGIFENGACYPKCIHWVNVVGYANDLMYWVIRNSWGEDWGIAGHMHLRKDYRVFDTGLCGIAKNVIFAEVGFLGPDQDAESYEL